MKPVEWRIRARIDVAEAAHWYALQGGLPLGERFLAQVDAALELLSHHPATGSTRHAAVMSTLPAPLRFLPVRRFDHHLVYYIDLPDRVEVIRVWNSARGLEALMEGPE